LSAEFAAQMTLFGAPQAARGSTSDPAPVGPSAARLSVPAPEPAPRAVFEQRAELRRERSRLVGELALRNRSSHREINAWLNRAVGIERVNDATIEQLERSVAALVKELSRGRPARARAHEPGRKV
jgi:hypothetical protein